MNLETQTKTVLDRETATTARHDARVEMLEAENTRLRTSFEALMTAAEAYPLGHAFAEDHTLRAAIKAARAELRKPQP